MKIQGNKAYIGDITAFPMSDYEEFETQTSANQVINFLQGKGDVELYINSGGGDVFEAMQIYNALRRHSQNHSVKVYVDGVSASAASFMMFGGSELFVPSNATIMIHKPTTFAWGNADELRSAVDMLNVVQVNIESIYNANAKDLSAVQIRHMVDNTTWFSGQEFADKFNCTLVTELGEDKSSNNKVLFNLKNRIAQAEEQKKSIADFLKESKPQTAPTPATDNNDNKSFNITRKIIF